MMPIRKGDGTGLSASGFSEVRKGDGTVLWSAGSDIPDSVVDNFDDKDLSEYSAGEYGSVSDWTTTTNPAVGTAALQSSHGDLTEIISTPTDGLTNYPTRGTETRGLVRWTNIDYGDFGDIANISLFGEATSPREACYSLRIAFRDDQVELKRYGDGNVGDSTLDSASVDLSSYTDQFNQWYLRDESGTLTLDLYDGRNQDGTTDGLSSIVSLSASDSSFSGQAVGYTKSGSNGTIIIDEIYTE